MSFVLAMAVSAPKGHPNPGKDGGGHPYIYPLWVTHGVDPAIASLTPRIPPRPLGEF